MLDLDARLTEIAPAGDTELHRHTYEALFYVVAGTGYSTISVDAGETERIEWQAGDLLATPRGTWHQHANGSSSEPARLLEVTTAPLAQAWGTLWFEKREPEFGGPAKRVCEPEHCALIG
ncbi:MAG: cupin domain-containing protein [Chthoniobacterales bacterium]|nr:cupin domain-containing protein [Chthoniobacterales bacterium]